MINKSLIDKIKHIKCWTQRGVRAPHKSLLILYAIGRIDDRYIPYNEIEVDLSNLLDRFGPVRHKNNPHQPFWRLKNDSIWEIPNSDLYRETSEKDVLVKDLRKNNAKGGFKSNYYEQLKSDTKSKNEIISFLLNDHFPSSYHNEILDAVNLSLDAAPSSNRDPKFREKVLKAYEYKCCICNLDIRIKGKNAILDAAHIKWHQAGGSSIESNGLCLCVLHHRIFDRGVIGLNNDSSVIISEYANGGDGFKNLVLNYNGKKINNTISEHYKPALDNINWHTKEVFKSPARKYNEH